MSWFKKNDKDSKERKEQPVDRPVAWPNGWAVRTAEATWYVHQGQRQRFFSDRCVESWCVPIRSGTDESLSLVPVREGILGFRTGSLIKDFSSGKIYLISGPYRHHVTNPDVLKVLGFPWILDVSQEEAGIHLDGEPINDLE